MEASRRDWLPARFSVPLEAASGYTQEGPRPGKISPVCPSLTSKPPMHNLCRKSLQMEHGSFKGTPDPCGGPAPGIWAGDATCVLESPSYRGSGEPVTGAPPVSLRTWNTYSIIPTVHPQRGRWQAIPSDNFRSALQAVLEQILSEKPLL